MYVNNHAPFRRPGAEPPQSGVALAWFGAVFMACRGGKYGLLRVEIMALGVGGEEMTARLQRESSVYISWRQICIHLCIVWVGCRRRSLHVFTFIKTNTSFSLSVA